MGFWVFVGRFYRIKTDSDINIQTSPGILSYPQQVHDWNTTEWKNGTPGKEIKIYQDHLLCEIKIKQTRTWNHHVWPASQQPRDKADCTSCIVLH